MILKDIKLKIRLKEISQKHPEIEDIILFGSAVRGKEHPNDIDVLVLFKDKINKETEYKIKKELEKKYKNISIVSKTKKTVLDASFDARESMLFGGISLITGKNLAEEYGFAPLGMFKYNFKDWNKLKKTKFYYALNGRNRRNGIIKELGCIKLSNEIILVPLSKIELFKDFLESWGIEYKYIPTIMPTRLYKEKFLK